MNRLLRVLSLSMLGITLYLSPRSTIAFDSKAIAVESNSASTPKKIRSSHWTYQSVKSLLAKYNCISKLPNGLFQPDRRTTRYELATALNACLRRNNNRFATQQDRDLAQSLQQEFKTELAEINNRTNELEARASTLEFKQFSPTSKLQGQTVITIQGGGF